MEYRIVAKPSYSLLELKMKNGEEVVAEPGAMAYMKNMEMSTGLQGNIFGVLSRKFLGGESILMNRFRCVGEEGLLGLTSTYPGDIAIIPVSPDSPVILQDVLFLPALPV